MLSVIYLTNCSAEKDDELKESGLKVSPDKLYTNERIQKFIEKCEEVEADWAIFSDNYGIFFHDERQKWYDKPPSSVTDEEFEELIKSFEKELKDYDKVIFYRDLDDYPNLFNRLFDEVDFVGEIVFVDDLSVIGDF